MDSICASQVKV